MTLGDGTRLQPAKLEICGPARCLVTNDSPDAYITLFKDKNGKKVFLYFEGSKKALKIMNYYNKNVVVSPDLSH